MLALAGLGILLPLAHPLRGDDLLQILPPALSSSVIRYHSERSEESQHL